MFKDDNTSCHKAKCIIVFLANWQIAIMGWPANSPDLGPIENMWWKIKKNSSRLNLHFARKIIAIHKCWKEINIDYCQSLITSMPARIKAVIKAHGGVTKY